MLWEIKLSEINFADPKETAAAIVEIITTFLKKIFGFIADDQGWVEE